MANGEDIFNVGVPKLGHEYRNVLVPKNKADWPGPWDCAEFASWCVFQAAGILYGCYNNNGNPLTAEAFTGYWKRDARSLGRIISLSDVARTKGAIALRFPIPGVTNSGHIVISDGNGGTIEAHSRARGVTRDRLTGRRWDVGVLVPGINYTVGNNVVVAQPTVIFKYRSPMMVDDKIKEIQTALEINGFDPKGIDGKFGKDTRAAVIAFQSFKGLVIDGEVGPETLEALGLV